MSEARERELGARLAALPVPEGTEDRLARVAARAAEGAARPWWRRRRIWGAAGLLLLAGGGAALALTLSGREAGLSVPPGGAAAEAGRLESPRLARLPWLYQPAGAQRIDAVTRAPSLRFPAGTTYPQALRELFAAVVARGELPRTASIGPPLPAGVAVRLPAGGAGVHLDLTAPWGYVVPTGAIRTPSLRVAATTDRQRLRSLIRALREGRIPAGPLPAGVQLEVPRLPACQVQRGAAAPAPCRLTAPPSTG